MNKMLTRLATLILAGGLMLGTANVWAQGQEGDDGDRAQRMFQRMDRNEDGKVTADEFRGPSENFTTLDKNKDGSLDAAEAAELRNLPRGERGGDNNRGGEDWRARMQERMLEGLKEQLKVTDEEWTVLQPRVQKVMEINQQRMMSGMGGFGGFGRRGGGGDQQQDETPSGKLRTLLQDENASSDAIQEQLKALRDAREKQAEELKAAREELQEIVTPRQEAVLVSNGILE